MIKEKNVRYTRKTFAAILAACMIMALGITAYATEGQIFKQYSGWGGNLEVKETDAGQEAMVFTDDLTEPVEICDGKMYFIVNGEHIDITDQISEEVAYQYEYADEDGITHLWFIGMNDGENPENYGYAEYLKDSDGELIVGYSARVNTEADGSTNAKWLEIAKDENNIPW